MDVFTYISKNGQTMWATLKPINQSLNYGNDRTYQNLPHVSGRKLQIDEIYKDTIESSIERNRP